MRATYDRNFVRARGRERERERLRETGSENDTKFTGKMFKTFLYFFHFYINGQFMNAVKRKGPPRPTQ